MLKYSEQDFERDTAFLASNIKRLGKIYRSIYPVPRGGIPVAIALSMKLGIPIDSKSLWHDCLVVDDIVDSGATRNKFKEYDFACLHVKDYTMKEFHPTYSISFMNEWVEYWWEEAQDELPAEDSVTRLIQSIGEDPNREGLVETPKRFVKAWQFLFSGYDQKVEDILTVFNSDGYDQIVLLKDIELYSMCEHHCLPFWGKAHVAYIPGKKLIGISKLARLVDMYSRRMQIQERIGDQVTNALVKYLQPQGAACIIEASHLCMRMRGVQKQNSVMVTSSLRGVFMDHASTAKTELISLIKGE